MTVQTIADHTSSSSIIVSGEKDVIEFVGKHHFKVGDKVYYLNNEIEGVDAESFEIYESSPSLGWMEIFSHDDTNLYARGELIEGADWETFDSFPDTGWYYWDKDWIYSQHGERFEASDVETFELVFGHHYAKDKNNVYVLGEIIAGADPETFVYDGYGQCSYDAEKYFTSAFGESYPYYFVEVSYDLWKVNCPSE